MAKNNGQIGSIEDEKLMYSLCLGTLFLCFVFLAFLMPYSKNQDFLTGAVVYTQNLTGAELKETIDFGNISSDNATQEIAFEAILRAQRDMEEMQEQGFGVSWVNDTIIEAKKYFEGQNYTALLENIERIEDNDKKSKAKELLLTAQQEIGIQVDYKKVMESAKAVNDRKKKSFEINDLIRAAQLEIEEAKEQLDVSEAESIFFEASNEFKNERYESAETLLANVDKSLNKLSSEATLVRTLYNAGKDNLTVYARTYYKEIFLFAGILIVVVILFYNRIMIRVLKRRLNDMKIEKDVLTELIKKSQEDYFVKGMITKQTFDVRMSQYKSRITQIRENLPVIETVLDKRLKSKRVL